MKFMTKIWLSRTNLRLSQAQRFLVLERVLPHLDRLDELEDVGRFSGAVSLRTPPHSCPRGCSRRCSREMGFPSGEREWH
jgi:hypothetical protein